MTITFGVSWDDSKKRGLVLLAAVAVVLSLVTPLPASVGAADGPLISVIVRELPGAGSAPEKTVAALGGDVERHISIIDGFTADVPKKGLAHLRAAPGIHSVTPDARIELQTDTYDGALAAGSMFNTVRAIKARQLWNEGFTGEGVDVALIDSGVAPVEGVTEPGKVINGPDLSFESGAPNLRYLDTFGHGTHMAGIIAGKDTGVNGWYEMVSPDNFVGVAPDSRIVNVKVADASGATDVSQVIAALDWVVKHRYDNGMNIRVLNLSFGTDGVQDYRIDPLAHAAEVAWRRGIVVVVAAGNAGYGSNKLNNPAYDPYVIAVGADDTKGTVNDILDDQVPSWSSRGNSARRPDFVAPGKSMVSLRVPNSSLDAQYPGGRVSDPRFFKGSGTSQSAAVVSGAAALLLDHRPNLTPDQVKALLMNTATPLVNTDLLSQGNGLVNIRAARMHPVPLTAAQSFPVSTGTGSLEAARGTAHVVVNGEEIRGERTVFGSDFDSNSWSSNSWSSNSWSGGDWSSNSWSGAAWQGGAWSSNSWSSNSWSSNSWSSNSWSSNSWSSNSWSSNSWSSNSWSSNSWSSNSWSSNSWSSNSWS